MVTPERLFLLRVGSFLSSFVRWFLVLCVTVLTALGVASRRVRIDGKEPLPRLPHRVQAAFRQKSPFKDVDYYDVVFAPLSKLELKLRELSGTNHCGSKRDTTPRSSPNGNRKPWSKASPRRCQIRSSRVRLLRIS